VFWERMETESQESWGLVGKVERLVGPVPRQFDASIGYGSAGKHLLLKAMVNLCSLSGSVQLTRSQTRGCFPLIVGSRVRFPTPDLNSIGRIVQCVHCEVHIGPTVPRWGPASGNEVPDVI